MADGFIRANEHLGVHPGSPVIMLIIITILYHDSIIIAIIILHCDKYLAVVIPQTTDGHNILTPLTAMHVIGWIAC